MSELQALSIRVIVVPARAKNPAQQRIELVTAARRHRACGAFRIRRAVAPSRGHAVIALLDRVTRKTTWRRVRLPSHTRAAHMVGLRVVELLQASLLELRLRPKQRVPRALTRFTQARTAPGKQLPPRRRRRGPRVGLRVDGVITGGPGGLGPVGQLQLAARWTPKPWLSVELTAATTPVGMNLTTGGATTSVSLACIAAWIQWELRSRGRWRPSLGLGAGVLVPWVLGQGGAGLIPRKDASLSGLVGLAAQTAVVLTSWLWLRVGFRCDFALPPIRVNYGPDTVARFGLPALTGHLGLELRTP